MRILMILLAIASISFGGLTVDYDQMKEFFGNRAAKMVWAFDGKLEFIDFSKYQGNSR